MAQRRMLTNKDVSALQELGFVDRDEKWTNTLDVLVEIAQKR